MSINALAASPGTDVDPVCSIRTATSPSAARIAASSSAYQVDHAGLYSSRCTVTA